MTSMEYFLLWSYAESVCQSNLGLSRDVSLWIKAPVKNYRILRLCLPCCRWWWWWAVWSNVRLWHQAIVLHVLWLQRTKNRFKLDLTVNNNLTFHFSLQELVHSLHVGLFRVGHVAILELWKISLCLLEWTFLLPSCPLWGTFHLKFCQMSLFGAAGLVWKMKESKPSSKCSNRISCLLYCIWRKNYPNWPPGCSSRMSRLWILSEFDISIYMYPQPDIFILNSPSHR